MDKSYSLMRGQIHDMCLAAYEYYISKDSKNHCNKIYAVKKRTTARKEQEKKSKRNNRRNKR